MWTLTLILFDPSSSIVRHVREERFSILGILFWMRKSFSSSTIPSRLSIHSRWLKERSRKLREVEEEGEEEGGEEEMEEEGGREGRRKGGGGGGGEGTSVPEVLIYMSVWLNLRLHNYRSAKSPVATLKSEFRLSINMHILNRFASHTHMHTHTHTHTHVRWVSLSSA